tara:strand:+ start:643 stop:768 length:126 start_codon:yes stop_codon:yes gene_type:complete
MVDVMVLIGVVYLLHRLDKMKVMSKFNKRIKQYAMDKTKAD